MLDGRVSFGDIGWQDVLAASGRHLLADGQGVSLSGPEGVLGRSLTLLGGVVGLYSFGQR
jgi:hypothetical protein